MGDLAPVRRSRLVACCALLIGLAMVQDPGLLVPDTKLDLVAAPADWLARSLHVWDAQGGFGQVQNQAHGYLWPMGPFFLLLDAIGLPGWVIQRLWQALVLSVALVGTAKLARAFGVRSDLACLVAGFAYALSPRMLTSLGPISIEVWPSALAPWVLLPLVIGAERGSPRRAAALSALAVAMVGGVNAAASFAVVPLAVIWILTRAGGARRRTLMLWWPIFTAMATAWWILPLLVMGGVGPPFLDFTETSAVTTFPTTLFDTLRGTSHWVPYLDADSRAGNELIRTGWLAVNTAVVVVVGLVGLLDRRIRHRTFLVVSLLVGVLLVTAGHHGAVQGWFSAAVGDGLDGALGPLRNVHKFDPVLRVPLVLGLAFVVDRLVGSWHRAPRRDAARLNAGVLVGAVVLGVVGSAAPAVAGKVEPARAMLGVPSYWSQAADFVGEHSDGGTTLLVPGSAFGDYLWGEPHDEPFQWLADSRWGVRSAGILAEPGHIRMLDGLERRFAEGRGSPGLAAALRRAGVEQLVVRNDLRPTDDIPEPALVHRAIADTPGLERVATFGPGIGGSAAEDTETHRTVYDGGRRASYPAIEVFAVGGAHPAVAAAEPTVVAGGPEDLPDLLDAGVIGSSPVQFLADADPRGQVARPRRVVLTDGLRARERQFARMHDGTSATITPGDRRRTTSRVRDFVLGGNDDDRWSTTARLDGVLAVSASGSASDAGTIGPIDRGRLPYASLDGAADTAWRSGPSASKAWWRVDLDGRRVVRTVRVVADPEAPEQRLRVVTAAGRSGVVELSPGGSREIRIPGDDTTPWVRVEGADAGALALAEVEVPDVTAGRTLVLPALPDGWESPDVVSLRADHDARTGCVAVEGRSGCAAGTARTGEDGPSLRRAFTVAAPRDYTVAVTVRPRAGAPLDALLLRDQPVSVQASSVAVPDPRAGAVAAVDGDDDTAWLAGPDDEHPELTIGWLGVRSVRGLVIDLAAATAARRPTEVALTFWRGQRRVDERTADVGDDGAVTFPAIRADRITVQVRAAEQMVDLRADGPVSTSPIGIGEIRVDGVPYLPLSIPADAVTWPCGTGPTVTIGGHRLRTTVTASPAALLAGRPLAAETCAGDDRLTLSGAVEVEGPRAPAFDVDTVTLRAIDDPGEPTLPVAADLDATDPVHRTLRPTGDDDVVVVRENANRGWTAGQGDRDLEPIVLDGWQQGFRLADDGPVAMRFGPDRSYRLGLIGGLAMLAGLLTFLGWTARRRQVVADLPPVGDLRLPRTGGVVGAVGALGLAGLVAGTTGALVAAVVVGMLLALPPLDEEAEDGLRWLLAAPVLVAGAAYSFGPWGGADGWAGDWAWIGYLALVPLVALPVVDLTRRSGKLRFRRIAGSSTSR